ncbi:MAG: ASCH domain-containing protein [Acidobacteria bacterium]|nr:ASCH domain-containing protein [Acidobacteriota bacterium]
MLFVKYLRDGIRSGAITSTVRVWHRPRVAVGRRYRMESGEVEVESIEPISFDDVTAEVAHSCGFATVEDLLRVARHGHGENVYLIRFHYIP